MKYSIQLYEIKQRQTTGYSHSAVSGYSYLSTFTQTFLAGSYIFLPDEIETTKKITASIFSYTVLLFQ